MALKGLFLLALPAATALCAPSLARGQDTTGTVAGPGPGTWGAELGVGGGQSAALLRFRSPTSAILIRGEAMWVEISEERLTIDGVQTQRYTLTSITARFGVRRYQGPGARVRPFSSVGVLAGYAQNPSGPGWTGGAFGDVGATYFFSPHVSLGAAGGLEATFTSSTQQINAQSLTRRQIGVRASAVQLLGAVYF